MIPAGYVWAYNTQPYFTDLGLTRDEIGTWMSWIPIVGGSLSVVTGGFIADRVVKRGLYARVMIIVISLVKIIIFICEIHEVIWRLTNRGSHMRCTVV